MEPLFSAEKMSSALRLDKRRELIVEDATYTDEFPSSNMKKQQVEEKMAFSAPAKDIMHIMKDDSLSPLAQEGSFSFCDSSEEVDILDDETFLPNDDEIQALVDLFNETSSCDEDYESGLSGKTEKKNVENVTNSPLLIDLCSDDDICEEHSSVLNQTEIPFFERDAECVLDDHVSSPALCLQNQSINRQPRFALDEKVKCPERDLSCLPFSHSGSDVGAINEMNSVKCSTSVSVLCDGAVQNSCLDNFKMQCPQSAASLFDKIDKYNSFLFQPSSNVPDESDSSTPIILPLNEQPKSPSCKSDMSLCSVADEVSDGLNNNLPNFNLQQTLSKIWFESGNFGEVSDLKSAEKQSKPWAGELCMEKYTETSSIEEKALISGSNEISYARGKEEESFARNMTTCQKASSMLLEYQEEVLDYEWEANECSELNFGENLSSCDSVKNAVYDSTANKFKSAMSNTVSLSEDLLSENNSQSSVQTPSPKTEVALLNDFGSNCSDELKPSEPHISCSFMSGCKKFDDSKISIAHSHNESSEASNQLMSPKQFFPFSSHSDKSAVARKLIPPDASAVTIVSTTSVKFVKTNEENASAVTFVTTKSAQFIKTHEEGVPSEFHPLTVRKQGSLLEDKTSRANLCSAPLINPSVILDHCSLEKEEIFLSDKGSGSAGTKPNILKLSNIESGNSQYSVEHLHLTPDTKLHTESNAEAEVLLGHESSPFELLQDSSVSLGNVLNVQSCDIKSSDGVLLQEPCTYETKCLPQDSVPLRSSSEQGNKSKKACHQEAWVTSNVAESVDSFDSGWEVEPKLEIDEEPYAKSNVRVSLQEPCTSEPKSEHREPVPSGSSGTEAKSVCQEPIPSGSSATEPKSAHQEPVPSGSSAAEPKGLHQEQVSSGSSAEQGNKSKEAIRQEALWVSSDAAENADNFDPEWDVLRKLETDEERYYALRKRWKSLTIPDARKNLSLQNFRKRRLGLDSSPSLNECSNGSTESDSKNSRKRNFSVIADNNNLLPPAKRPRLLHCTQVYKDKINEVEWELREEFKLLEAEKKQALDNISMQQQTQFEKVFYSNMPYHVKQQKLNQIHNQQTRAIDVLSDDFDWRIQEARQIKLRRVELLTKAQEEVFTFNKFYHNLHNAENSDQLSITEDEAKAFEESENMYAFFDNFYRG